MSTARWDDLVPRVASAAVMVCIAAAALWWGGLAFRAMVSVACALMLWELMRLCAPHPASAPVQIALLGGAVLMVAPLLPAVWMLPVVLAVVVAGLAQAGAGQRVVWAGYGAMILLAGLGMILVRAQAGAGWMTWLIALVAITDVAGYFAGKTFGGPLLWPRVSPKKTWSGTVAGWAGAALTGALFAGWLGVGAAAMAALSVLLAVAAQAGDIAESAIKRRAGVKDSSALIPGHGGVLDRFDGMVGAALMLFLVWFAAGMPPGVS
jgi:phosphatidate cytidylyltransferase